MYTNTTKGSNPPVGSGRYKACLGGKLFLNLFPCDHRESSTPSPPENPNSPQRQAIFQVAPSLAKKEGPLTAIVPRKRTKGHTLDSQE